MASEPKTVPTPDIADKLEVEGRPMSMHTAAANEGNRGFSLFVTVHIAPERMDEFLGYFQPVYDRLSAMPECGLFQVYRSPTDAGVLAWVEDWNVPPEWLLEGEHKQPYFKEYIKLTEPMWTKPREVHLLERLPGPVLTQPLSTPPVQVPTTTTTTTTSGRPISGSSTTNRSEGSAGGESMLGAKEKNSAAVSPVSEAGNMTWNGRKRLRVQKFAMKLLGFKDRKMRNTGSLPLQKTG